MGAIFRLSRQTNRSNRAKAVAGFIGTDDMTAGMPGEARVPGKKGVQKSKQSKSIYFNGL
jgi:hypothetical protein